MPGIVGAVGAEGAYGDKKRLVETIDLLGIADVEQRDVEGGFMAAASLKNAPLKGPRFFDNGDVVAVFAGDLVGVDSVPWDLIATAVKSGTYDALGSLRGNFGLAAYDRKQRKVILATDPRSQHPVYHRTLGRGLVFSTELGAFFRLAAAPDLSRAWLYETVFFNFPVTPATFLEGVYRVPPGCAVVFDPATGEQKPYRYVEPYRRSERLLKGREALDHALSVFKARVPAYFEGGDGKIAVSLTGGWDSRAILSLCPDRMTGSVFTYTYGMPGTDDLVEAADVAKRLCIEHRPIHFQDDFIAQMPNLMQETVYLSNGLEGPLRAPVLYADRILTDHGRSCPAVITGISFDAMFKGYGNVPSMISPGMDLVFREGRAVIAEDRYRDIFEDRYQDFAAHIMDNLTDIHAKYGDFATSDCHLTYIVYDVCPNIFLGEMALTGQYSTFRVPCWDEDIVRLAYNTEFSRLTFSYYVGHPKPWAQNRLHTYILRSNPRYAGIPVAGIPLWVWWRGGTIFDLYRMVFRAPRRYLGIDAKTKIPIADWAGWMRSQARSVIDDLIFADHSMLRAYIGARFLGEQKEQRSPHWVGKLARLELILRQMDKGWRLDT